MPRKVLDAWGDFYPSAEDDRPGKALLWCDPLYPTTLFGEGDDMERLLNRSRAALETVRPYRDTTLECEYAAAVFEALLAKGPVVAQLRARYVAGDKAWLRALAEEIIPDLIARYDRLMRAHRALWERDNRRFGWEVLCLRYGAAEGRLRDVQDELRRYLRDELEAVEELDAKPWGLPSAAITRCTAR